MDVNRVANTMILKHPPKRSTAYLNAYTNTEEPFHSAVISCGYLLSTNPVGVVPGSLEREESLQTVCSVLPVSLAGTDLVTFVGDQ